MADHPTNSVENAEKDFKSLFITGGITTIIALGGILLDIIIGSLTGGDLTTLPQTAVDRFTQLHNNSLLGLYNLDLLNVINQLLLVPGYFTLLTVHRKVKPAYAALAFIIFLSGTIIFIANNTALPMLELSSKYAFANSDTQKLFFEAAGEAMLARGAHGSLGVFIGFILPNIAGIIISVVMIKGKIFSTMASYFGITGNSLLVIYLILITFTPAIKNMATVFALPGGLLVMAWMILFTIKLFKLGQLKS
ncbi:MAG: DUF4386 family protein [Bacteroidetes bacterium]|nr:DUF4386 family protein [Bacteroidota bacterium]